MEEGVWGCFWIISGHRACQWRRFGSARCFSFFCRGLVLYSLWSGVGGRGWYGKDVNVRRWIAKGRMQVGVVGCGFLLAHRRYCRKGRHHRRHRRDYDEALTLHLVARLPVWGFGGLRSPLRLAPCLLCKIVGRGCYCDGGDGGRGERA